VSSRQSSPPTGNDRSTRASNEPPGATGGPVRAVENASHPRHTDGTLPSRRSR
jgi:hypothetical protein